MYSNSTDTAMCSPEVVKAGYLTKSPPWDAPPMSQWRRRWFVLCDSFRAYPLAERHVRMEYYQNEGDVRKLCDPKGVIELKNCTRVSSVARIKGHNYVFDICTKERTYHIAAETPTEKYEWMKTLNELLFTPPTAPDGTKMVQDLENAEMLRRKSVSKASAERQNSLGDLVDNKQRPVSCFIRPEMKTVVENKSISPTMPKHSNKQRPLPPTPDATTTTVTLQHAPLQTSYSVPSPSPPVPKPRSKNSVENNKPNSSSSPSLVPASDLVIQTPSAGYDKPSKTSGHNYQNIEQPSPPPLPKPRSKNSLEDNYPNVQKFQPTPSTPTVSRTHTSGYENVAPDSSSAPPDYEDIDVEDTIQPAYETHFVDELHPRTSGSDCVIFLKGDPDTDEDQMNEPSNYEVPVNILSSPPLCSPPPQRTPNTRSSFPTSLSATDEDVPPVPPPRNRIRRENSIHRSLIDLVDEGFYSELKQDEIDKQISDDEHYGRLIRYVGTHERRFSDPEIQPMSPRSHSNSPLFFNIKQSPPPPPLPYSNKKFQKHYYENTGYADRTRYTTTATTNSHNPISSNRL